MHKSTIALILTNKSLSFPNSIVIDTGFNDHPKLLVTFAWSPLTWFDPKNLKTYPKIPF